MVSTRGSAPVQHEDMCCVVGADDGDNDDDDIRTLHSFSRRSA